MLPDTRIVTLESVLRDTRMSVDSIIAGTDQMLEQDTLSPKVDDRSTVPPSVH